LAIAVILLGGYAFVNLDVSFITPNTASAAVPVLLAPARAPRWFSFGQ